jgi:hypothetical protein
MCANCMSGNGSALEAVEAYQLRRSQQQLQHGEWAASGDREIAASLICSVMALPGMSASAF